MEKLRMHTPDMAEENYKKLAALFPNAVTETIDDDGNVVRAIDKDVLMQEINTKVVDDGQERYQFTWPDKRKAIILANQPIAKTLRFEKEKSVGRDGTPGGTDSENIYIEGDNLDALKLLQETYLGKVKMIYIDPPYNTGNDFIYEDDFSQSIEEYARNSGQQDEEGNRLVQNSESNGRFHTDWLNMMYPRLKIAKDLLSDDGVIFISIDDSEQENLKKICDEIFGSKNYVSTFLWTKTSTPPSLSNKCRKVVEYIFAYEKKINNIKYFGSLLDGGDAPFLNSGNSLKTLEFPIHSIKFNFIDNGTITAGRKEKIVVNNDVEVMEGWNKNIVRLTGEFKWEQQTVDSEIQKGTYFIIKSDKFSIRFQRVDLKNSYKTPTNIINIELNKFTGVGTNESAAKELTLLGMEGYFDYPKPLSLISKIINMIGKTDKDLIIMDFFSGSATSAHAVIRLNAEDNGSRKYIMVQLPEKVNNKSNGFKDGFKTICDIGEERIRRAGKKIKEKTSADIDYGFRCFKVDSSNMEDVYYKPSEVKQAEIDLFADNIKADRTPEDLLIQVMLDLGVLLSSKVEKTQIAGKHVFSVAEGYLIACFDDEVTEEVVTAIAKKKPFYAVFRDSSMADDSVAANFEQIFATYSPQTVRKVL